MKPLNPTKIYNQDISDDDCWFEFTITGEISILISIEKYETEAESHKSTHTYLLLEADANGLESEKDLPFERLDTNNSWDEQYFIKAKKIDSGFILLRKGKIVITTLSNKNEILLQIEKMLCFEESLKIVLCDSLKSCEVEFQNKVNKGCLEIQH